MRLTRRRRPTALALAGLLLVGGAGVQTATAPPAEAATLITSASISINPSSKTSVRNAYVKHLAPALKVPSSWSGKVSGCKTGSESTASKKATVTAINFYREMVGLDPVSLNDSYSAAALRSSLVMDANDTITHTPSSSSRCWTKAAAEAAKTSNLALSWGGSGTTASTTGARAVASYMKDSGDTNTAVGHRRWILNWTTRQMGTGSTHRSNTLKVIGVPTSTKAARPKYVEWPSAGYFPTQLEPSGRWSLSSNHSKADFSKAKVKVTVPESGRVLPVKQYKVQDGYGPDTLVWKVGDLRKPNGKTVKAYKVTVTGIKGMQKSTYSYTVKMFDVYP